MHNCILNKIKPNQSMLHYMRVTFFWGFSSKKYNNYLFSLTLSPKFFLNFHFLLLKIFCNFQVFVFGARKYKKLILLWYNWTSMSEPYSWKMYSHFFSFYDPECYMNSKTIIIKFKNHIWLPALHGWYAHDLKEFQQGF